MSKKYEYKFVRLGIEDFEVPGSHALAGIIGSGSLEEAQKYELKYQGIIQEYSKEGWRFIQAFAPPSTASGAFPSLGYVDLIFEREIK